MVNSDLPRPAPGHGGDRETSPIAAELARRSDNIRQRDGVGAQGQQRLALMPVRAFILAMGALLGMLVCLGIGALVSWLQGGGSHINGAGKAIFVVGGIVGSAVIFAAVLMWRLPERRGLRNGVVPLASGRVTRYLLRNARDGAFGGPVNVVGGVPPFQICLAWFWALLFSIVVAWIGWFGWPVIALNLITLGLLLDSWRKHRVSLPKKSKS